jgi:hypothetical protein
LESALARPRSGYYSDLIQEAAASTDTGWNSTTPARFRSCWTSTRQAECGSRNSIDGFGNTPRLQLPRRRGALSPAALQCSWRGLLGCHVGVRADVLRECR